VSDDESPWGYNMAKYYWGWFLSAGWGDGLNGDWLSPFIILFTTA
jgi:hypothetical protein